MLSRVSPKSRSSDRYSSIFLLLIYLNFLNIQLCKVMQMPIPYLQFGQNINIKYVLAVLVTESELDVKECTDNYLEAAQKNWCILSGKQFNTIEYNHPHSALPLTCGTQHHPANKTSYLRNHNLFFFDHTNNCSVLQPLYSGWIESFMVL